MGPRADGTLCDEEKAILSEIGKWLKVNGEAIFDTDIWRISSEGPTEVAGGPFTDGDDKVFTSADFRFTMKSNVIYAFCLNYPADGKLTIKSFAEYNSTRRPEFHGIIDKVEVLQTKEEPAWIRDDNGMHIETESIETNKPVVIKITTK